MQQTFDLEEQPEAPKGRKRYMVVDASNFLWRNRFAQVGMSGTADEINSYSIHTALFSLNRFYKMHKPDKIVLAFDKGKSWRKAVLPMYKERRQEKRKKDKGIADFYLQIEEFYTLMRDHSSMIVLRKPLIEADDWIARFIQTHPEADHVIISNDGDFHQLHKHQGVQQWNPMRKKGVHDGCWVDVEDPLYAIFLKCIRGETGESSDNIPSAYPRIFETKLKKAFYGDAFEMNEIMLHEIPDITQPLKEKPGEFKMVKVKELYERNQELMHLEMQPNEVITSMDNELRDVGEGLGKFELFYFLQYLGQRNLQRIADTVDNFIPLFKS